MSKLSKLIKKPNLFFRDYFIKKAPLNYGENIELLPAEKGYVKNNSVKVDKKAVVNPTSNNSLDQVIEDLYPITFPIDIVYTWVDSDDPKFQEKRLSYQAELDDTVIKNKPEVTDIARFQSRDELKYSIRSVLKYAPWVNHIYIVTNGQVPRWLDTEFEKVTVVPHSEILEERHLPTFNSHVIESALYKIPNLSEHYIYFNDDVMLTRPLAPNYFFTSNGIVKLFVTNARLPNGGRNLKDTPTQWAAKNSRELLYKETGFWVEHMFAHTFHPQLKSIHRKIETLWAESLEQCRKNRFRDVNDLNSATFLHHHFALISGNAMATRTKCIYFNIRSPEATKFYATLNSRKGTDLAPHSICLNDHVSGNKNFLKDYEIKLQNFLEGYYPEPSEAEISLPDIDKIKELVKKKSYQAIYDKLQKIVDSRLVNPSNKKHAYVFYYLGISAYFLHKEKEDNELLDFALQNLSDFCKLNNSHKLAVKYLEEIKQEKGISNE